MENINNRRLERQGVVDQGEDLNFVQPPAIYDAPIYKGDDGRNAFEIAQAGGFFGTEQEWLQSLKGEGIDNFSADPLAYYILAKN